MMSLRLWMYFLIIHIPADYIASTTGEYSHSPSSTRQAVIPAIRRSNILWSPSNTFNIAPVTTQLSLPYSSTVCATTLYNIPRALTVSPLFVNTFYIIPHFCQTFCKLVYAAAQLLLLYDMVRPS